MKSIFASVSGAALVAAAMVAPNVAAAQADDRAPPQVSEVVVTAQKTEQRLQDVPLSVSAVTNREIENRGVTRLEDMQFSVPGLSSVEYGPGKEFIQIRGIASTLSAPTIGNFLDEMPITGDLVGGTVDMRLYDMQRVEVLRGPQGTLYGEGSMGGTIRYITADPQLDAFSGRVEGELGSVTDGGTSYKADGMLNIPIVKDLVGLRLVAGYERTGGWIDNVATGEKDINPTTTKTIRGKLLIAPTDATRISLLVLHQELEQPNQNFAFDRIVNSTVDTFNNGKYTLVNGVLNQDLGPVKLVESLGYLDYKTQSAFDLTPFYLPVLEGLFGVPPGAITQIPYPADQTQRIFTNETRFSSDGEGPFNWTAGFYYRDSKTRNVSEATTAPLVFPLEILTADLNYHNTSYAVFGEANYQLTDKLNALVGLRYFHDHRIFDSASVAFGFPAVDHGDGTFHSVDPRFNLRYEFSPTSMVYVNVAKGFRSGGFNLTSAGGGVFTVPPTYDPETLWTYEVGTKHQLFDRRLEIEGAVYYSDWTDVQSYEFAPGSAVTITVNGGKVSGWGFDGSATWHAAPGLNLSATYGWNNLAFDTTTADKNAGDPVDFAVHNSASASLDYRRPLTGTIDGFFRADYQHSGPAQITLRNFGNEINRLPARDLVNLRVGVDVGQVEVGLFATNVFDNDKPLIPGPFGVILQNIEQRPRTIGVNVQAKF
jgi:outer membrane receptor protein involved in Fe transport